MLGCLSLRPVRFGALGSWGVQGVGAESSLNALCLGMNYGEIRLGRTLLLLLLVHKSIPREVAELIADTWALREYKLLQRRRRSMYEFGDDGVFTGPYYMCASRFYGPGY